MRKINTLFKQACKATTQQDWMGGFVWGLGNRDTDMKAYASSGIKEDHCLKVFPNSSIHVYRNTKSSTVIEEKEILFSSGYLDKNLLTYVDMKEREDEMERREKLREIQKLEMTKKRPLSFFF